MLTKKILFILLFGFFLSQNPLKGAGMGGNFIPGLYSGEDTWTRAVNHYKKGLDFLKNNQWQNALTAFSDATKVKKNFADSYFEMGKIYFQQNNRPKASKYFKLYIQYLQDSTHPIEHLKHIESLSILKSHEIEESQTLLNQLDHQLDHLLIKGMLLDKLDQKQSAIIAYESALNLEEMNTIAHLNLGKLYFETKDIEKSLIHFENYIHDSQASDIHLAFYASALKQKGQLMKAAEFFGQAYQKNKRQPAHIVNKAMCLFFAKQYGSSKDLLIQTTKDWPHFSYPHYFLGIMFQDIFKNQEKAIYHFNKFQKLHPNNSDAWSQEVQKRWKIINKNK